MWFKAGLHNQCHRSLTEVQTRVFIGQRHMAREHVLLGAAFGNAYFFMTSVWVAGATVIHITSRAWSCFPFSLTPGVIVDCQLSIHIFIFHHCLTLWRLIESVFVDNRDWLFFGFDVSNFSIELWSIISVIFVQTPDSQFWLVRW